jgi:hypothetical protein
MATAEEGSRVFTTASGYARPAAWLDLYHFGLLDVAGAGGPNLTNGSLGANLHLTSNIQLTTSINHVSTDLLRIAARNVLADPDPTAIGVVQNDIAIIRVSQDVARAGTSVALAKSRFELSVSGGYHRRPGVAVALADGGSVVFPEARSTDATLSVLDRKSIAKLRAQATATVSIPLGDSPNRSRSTVVRLLASRTLRDDRAELAADVMLARFRGTTSNGACADSLDVFQCFSAATTSAAQAGVLGSYRVGREWLVLLDTHVGMQDVRSTTVMGAVELPRVLSLTMFARVQWRYR